MNDLRCGDSLRDASTRGRVRTSLFAKSFDEIDIVSSEERGATHPLLLMMMRDDRSGRGGWVVLFDYVLSNGFV